MSKGTRRERQACELYQMAGFATYRPATVRFGENDMFGLFDLLAVSPSYDRVRAVQVKSNGAAGIEAWRRHTSLFRSLGWDTEYAVPMDNAGWRLIACEDHGTVELVDERYESCNMGEGIVEHLRDVSDR